jgi:hypothetical protein
MTYLIWLRGLIRVSRSVPNKLNQNTLKLYDVLTGRFWHSGYYIHWVEAGPYYYYGGDDVLLNG